MYGIFTYISHKFKPNAGKYTIHWVFGKDKFLNFRGLNKFCMQKLDSKGYWKAP